MVAYAGVIGQRSEIVLDPAQPPADLFDFGAGTSGIGACAALARRRFRLGLDPRRKLEKPAVVSALGDVIQRAGFAQATNEALRRNPFLLGGEPQETRAENLFEPF